MSSDCDYIVWLYQIGLTNGITYERHAIILINKMNLYEAKEESDEESHHRSTSASKAKFMKAAPKSKKGSK